MSERDDEIARLRERWEASQLHCHELIDRAETAEARLAEQEGRIADVVANITEEQAGRQAAEATVARVKALHQPRPGKQIKPCEKHGRFFDSLCVDCRSEPITVCSSITCCDWPCRTWEALTEPAQQGDI